MEWFPRCGAQPLKGQKELRAKTLKLGILRDLEIMEWGVRLVAESNLHDMCIYYVYCIQYKNYIYIYIYTGIYYQDKDLLLRQVMIVTLF